MRVKFIAAVLATVLAGAAPDALAYNVLKNGDFNGGIAGWNVSSTGGGSAGSESYFGTPAGG